MTGVIFDVKEFALNDGDGIRTTVFFKGCSLRCIWCHNPEGLSARRELYVSRNGCLNCGLCLRPCDHEDCRGLGRCIHICPRGLVKAVGRTVEASALAGELKKSSDFLIGSGGGITLSGGEVMMQPDFAAELMRLLKPLNTAVETCGYTDGETFLRVISLCELVLFDIKLCDREAHKKYTGVFNDCILENFRLLAASGKRFRVRVPLIPGITDTDENLYAIAKISDGAPVELLSYNRLAGAKYENVGRHFTDVITEQVSRIKDTAGLPANFTIRKG